jgi:hypothetical protein
VRGGPVPVQGGPVILPIPDESFAHLFFACTVTSNILETINHRLLPELNLNTREKAKKFYFCGVNPITNKIDSFFLQLLPKVILFSIWESKLSKQVPSSMKVLNDRSDVRSEIVVIY